MKLRDYALVAAVGAALAFVPLVVTSATVLNFLVFTLLIALAAQGWNILGGYGGQVSFGHAAFFGTGAYVTAVLQTRYGVNAWAGFALGVALGALAGWIIGFLTFRTGLRGSYFALVTLAFAEVLRMLANSFALTGGGAGVLIKLDVRPENFQFASRAGFYWIALALVVAAMLVSRRIETTRFGAQLAAVRENEAAAQALGVDPFWVKMHAITLSAAVTAAAGAFYAQYFLFIDSGIAYGAWISIEALLAPIVGGLGTVFGPLLGALVLHGLGELAKHLGGAATGINLAVYGALLILAVAYLPNGVTGWLSRFRKPAPLPEARRAEG